MSQSTTPASSVPIKESDTGKSSNPRTTSSSPPSLPESRSRSSAEQSEPLQFSSGSCNDSESSKVSRHLKDVDKLFSNTTDIADNQKRPSQHAAISTTTSEKKNRGSDEVEGLNKYIGSDELEKLDEDEYEDYEYEDEDEYEVKPTIRKKHSQPSSMNVYTECGRHGDEWLFGGISESVKHIFKKP